MGIIAHKTLVEFWERYPEAEIPLRAWFAEVSRAEWWNFADVKQAFNSVDRVGERLVFNIGGNKFRLVARVDFQRYGVLIRFVGTHRHYDRIDAGTV